MQLGEEPFLASSNEDIVTGFKVSAAPVRLGVSISPTAIPLRCGYTFNVLVQPIERAGGSLELVLLHANHSGKADGFLRRWVCDGLDRLGRGQKCKSRDARDSIKPVGRGMI